MGLQPYDAEKHHVGLGPSETDLDGYILAGGYGRSGQQTGTPADFGGQTDLLSAPSLSRWSVDDFSGGAYAYSWGKDPAAFAGSLNLVPTKFDATLRTVPPLVLFAARNRAGLVPMLVCASDGFLYAVFSDQVEKWDTLTGARTVLIGGYATVAANTIRAAAVDSANKHIILQFDAGVFHRVNVPGGSLASGWAAPSTVVPVGATAEGLITNAQDIIFSHSSFLYKVTVPNAGDPASTDFLKVGRLPGVWIDACVYNGLVYVLVGRKDQPSILLQWAGTSGLLPVTEFPYNFVPETVRVYGGRIYVGGSARDFADSPKYGALFEVTGASLRLVRDFAPESRASSSTSNPKSLYHFAVHEGLLFFGDTGRGLSAYDLTTDALYGASQLQPPDGQRQIRRVLSYRDTLFAWINHPLDHAQDGWYKVIVPGEVATSAYEGQLITSDFAPEPDRHKRWSQLRILTRYGPATAGYSFQGGSPGGDTFNELDTTSTVVERNGDLYLTTIDLSTIDPSTAIRLRIRLPRGQGADGFTELVAYTLSFAFLDTGKWAWRLTVNGTSFVEGRDRTGIRQDVSDVGSTLLGYWKDKTPLSYRDVDGQTYRAQLVGIDEQQPVIGPRVEFVDPTSGSVDEAQEAFYALTLIEV